MQCILVDCLPDLNVFETNYAYGIMLKSQRLGQSTRIHCIYQYLDNMSTSSSGSYPARWNKNGIGMSWVEKN